MSRRPSRGFVADPWAYHEEITVSIETLTNLGVGLGRVDGWVVMVPFTIPGEVVRARVFKNHKNYSEADLVAVVTPSPDRVTPVCSLFGTCGGCQYQHLSYAGQLRAKRQQVAEVLQKLGGIQADVLPPIHAEPTYGYRLKLTPHHGKFVPGRPLEIGFLRTDSRRIVDVPQCPIATESINAKLPQVRAAVQERAARGKFRKGGTLLLREVEEGVATDPRANVTTRVGDLVLEHLAGGFFQNNAHVLPAMVAHVVAETGPCRYLVDTYCGVGLFALAAAPAKEQCLGVEISESAIGAARRNAERNGLANARFQAASAEAIFAEVTFPAAETAVVIDPPRAGCDETFLRQLVGYGPQRIVYVSCDPATQARDAKFLAAEGFQVERVQPFDLFPQTRHIENVITFTR